MCSLVKIMKVKVFVIVSAFMLTRSVLGSEVEVNESPTPAGVIEHGKVSLKCSFAISSSDVEIGWEKKDDITFQTRKNVIVKQKKVKVRQKLYMESEIIFRDAEVVDDGKYRCIVIGHSYSVMTEYADLIVIKKSDIPRVEFDDDGSSRIIVYVACGIFLIVILLFCMFALDSIVDHVSMRKYNKKLYMSTKGANDMFEGSRLVAEHINKRVKHSSPYPVNDSMETLREQLLSPDHCAVGTDKPPHITLSLSDDTAYDATRGPAERKIVSASSHIEIV